MWRDQSGKASALPEGSGFVDCAEEQSTPYIPGEWVANEGAMTEYRCEAATVEGFVQQLAVNYVGNGYFFYVTGVIPEHKDPKAVDRKLILKYRIGISKWARMRRKAQGTANVQYLRHGRFYVLVATHGRHPFFRRESDGGEGDQVKDLRRVPIKFASYSIGYRGGHPHVGIERGTYLDLKSYLLDLALRRPKATLEREFWNLPFEPYAPVRRQLVTMFKGVNERRSVAGLEPLEISCLRLRRRICRPFDLASDEREAA